MSTHPKTDKLGEDVTAIVELSTLRPEDMFLLAGQKVTVQNSCPASDIIEAPNWPHMVEYQWNDADGWGWTGYLVLPSSTRVEVFR